MLAPWRSQNPLHKTWVSDYWKIIHSAPFLNSREAPAGVYYLTIREKTLS